MSIIELNFTEHIRTIFAMSLTGSIVALLLFLLKPFIKNKLPKSFQYYTWLAVIIALIVPLSKYIELPKITISGNNAIPSFSIYDMVQRSFSTIEEELDRFTFLSHRKSGSEQQVEKTQNQLLSIAPIIFIVWSIGMFIFLSFNFTCYKLFIRKLKNNAVCANAHEIELLNGLSKNKYVPCLWRSHMAPTPMLIGVFRPKIVLPNREYTETQLTNILLHELTHLRRYDVFIKWLTVLAGAFHWFNPIIYIVRREIYKACELSCDEAVIKNFDMNGKQNYGDALIEVVATHKTPIAILSTTMGEDKKDLKERLTAIMNHTKFSRKAIVFSSIPIVTVLYSMIYLGSVSGAYTIENPNYQYGSSYSNDEIARKAKEIELESNLLKFDKIEDANVLLLTSEDEITSVSIFLKIIDVTNDSEIDNILLLLSENLENLDIENIQINDQNGDVIFPQI